MCESYCFYSLLKNIYRDYLSSEIMTGAWILTINLLDIKKKKSMPIRNLEIINNNNIILYNIT